MVFGSYFEEEQKEQMDFAHQEEMIKQFEVLLEEVDETLKERFKKFHQGNPIEALTRLLKGIGWNVQEAHKMKPVIPTNRLFRAVGDSEIMGFSGYPKEPCHPKVFSSFKGCNPYIVRCVEASLSLRSADFDLLDYVGGHDIAAGSIITSDGIPGLVQVTNANCYLSLMMSQLPCPDEYFAVKEWVKCYPCIRVEEFEGALKNMKNKFGISDFLDFVEAWKAGDKKTIPLYLEYLHNVFGCNVTATTTHSNDMIALPLGLFYAAIDEMHKMQLEDIMNEDVILKWGCVMRDAKKMGLDVEFAEEHLKKIAHSYFQLPELDAAREQPAICSMSERESFEDGSPLTKGLLLFARGERSA